MSNLRLYLRRRKPAVTVNCSENFDLKFSGSLPDFSLLFEKLIVIL
jgi:hypothetical protein